METCTDTDTVPDHNAAAAADVRRTKPPLHAWVRELAIVLGFYYVYQTIRSLADHGGVKNRAYGNARLLVRWEEAVYIFHEQSIQQAFLGAHWFIKVMNIYYGTLHFIFTAGLLVWVYMRRHHAYRRMRNLLGLTTGLALVGYWSFPLAPPRLYLKCDGDIPVLGPEGGLVRPHCFVDTLEEIGGLWSYHSPVAKAVANAYAAMPSLHFGWALWCAIVLWRYVGGRKGRIMAFVYPSLTLFAIVVTANHYFLDAAGGVILLLAAVWLLQYTGRRRSSRQAARTTPLASAT